MNIKLIKMSSVLAAALLSASAAVAGDDGFKSARTLFDHGLYSQAYDCFAALGDNALNDGYEILCILREKGAVKHRNAVESDVAAYEEKYGDTSLSPMIHFYLAEWYFDKGEYSLAAQEYQKAGDRRLSKKESTSTTFKQAYCDYIDGRTEEALYKFEKVAQMPFSDYTAPSEYFIASIRYADGDFHGAIPHFEKCITDARFADNALYYLLECHFMLKDYDYVRYHGEDLYYKVPEQRRGHLARIISETYLVLGDTAKAKEFYDRESGDETGMTRADRFYAGSLKYALGNYQGAVEDFMKMESFTDSLGQVASYELGYSYIKLKDKVSAMNAFDKARALPFRADISEDASFNYAKLAFDLNHDTVPFKSYLKKYPDAKQGDQIYSYMALASLMDHDYAASVEAYDNVEVLTDDMKANYMKANYLRANELINRGSCTDAVPCLKAAAFYTPKQDNFNKLCRYWLAECYYRTGKYEDALKIYSELYNLSALDGYPEGDAITYNMAYCFFKTGDYAGASRWFGNYLLGDNADHREDASIRKSDCHFLMKDYSAAAQGYSAVISEFGSGTTFYPLYQLGLSYGLCGNVAKKIESLQPVRTGDPKLPFYADALYELGRAYVSDGRQADAFKCFQTLVENSSDRNCEARSLIELGMISRNRGEMNEAVDFYRKVVENYSETGYREDALLALEAIYQASGEPEKYIAYVERLGNPMNRTESEKEMLYYSSAEQIFLNGNYEKALVALQKYIDLYPEGTRLDNARFYMAECQKELGNKESACALYAKVAESSASGPFLEAASLNYAVLSFEMDRFRDAYGAYSSLLEIARIENNKYTAKLGMMRSAYRARDYEIAIKACEVVERDSAGDDGRIREARLLKAKSLLSLSRRDEAFSVLSDMAKSPDSPEGAEAAYMIIQDTYDRGLFDQIEDKVYEFSSKASSQPYWLAKSFIVLGDSFVERDNVEQAKATFESIAGGYEPQGAADDVLQTVKMRLEKLNELMK